MHSKQGFALEIPYLIGLLEKVKKGYGLKDELKDEIGIGRQKIDVQVEWLRFVQAIEIENQKIKLTKLGEFYLEIRYNDEFLEPIMLYYLLRNPFLEENNGHFYYSTLVNEIFYEMIFEYKDKISLDEIKEKFLLIDSNKNNLKFVSSALTGLVDGNVGFGKIGIVEKVEKDYEVHSYWVEPLVAAYIIYDLWDENMVSKSIKEIETEKYHIGRMFLMDEDAVRETLEEIQALKLINIETIAGLNQIRINPNITKEDILNMIIKEA